MDRIDEIQARVDAATAGPWEWNEHHELQSTTAETESYFGSPVEPVTIIITDSGFYPPEDHDRPFIAHARSDIPYLLARVRELEAGLAEYANDDNWTYSVDWGIQYWTGESDAQEIARFALAGES
jgi:hypothetical protein